MLWRGVTRGLVLAATALFATSSAAQTGDANGRGAGQQRHQPTASRPASPSDAKAGEESFAAFLAMVEEDALQAPQDSSAAAVQDSSAAGPQDSSAAGPQGSSAAGPRAPNAQTANGRAAVEQALPNPRRGGPGSASGGSEMPEAIPAPPGSAERQVDAERLVLADVVASVYRAYPEIERARQFLPEAGGELLSAYGSYDTKFDAQSLSEPTGFYENYRHGLGVARQTWWGGYLSAGYRIGRGFFQPWYKERQTDDAGEFKLKASQPLLQGRAIDPERVAVFQASLRQQAATPRLQQTILGISSEAISVYWDWVSAGAVLQAQQELLDLAEQRGEQFERGVEAGKFAPVDLVLNRQLIAERKALVLKAEQKFRATAFKLGLYLRGDQGQPLYPSDAWLPSRFPIILDEIEFDPNSDLAAALRRRPEPSILTYELRQVQLDRQLANNNLLPRLDFVTEASQDMGEPATKSDDKGEFELMIGISSEVPIQRRKARGKIQSTSAKIIQINEKLRLVRDKIATDLQIAYNRLMLAADIVEQSEESFVAALDTLVRYRSGFEKGYIDLIYLNLLETKANETEIKLIEAQQQWFSALAQLQLVLGLDPLEQAIAVSELPLSERPGPGNLPEMEAPSDEEVEEAFQGRANGNVGGNPNGGNANGGAPGNAGGADDED